MASSQISPPPIRGGMDLSQPFMITVFDRTPAEGVEYLLVEVNYVNEVGNTVSEAIFTPSFSGQMTYPYTSLSTNGTEWFGVYSLKGQPPSVNNTGVITGLPNFANGGSNISIPLHINYIQPLVLRYSTTTGGFLLSSITYNSSGAPYYLCGDAPLTSPNYYSFRTLLLQDKSKALTFTIGGGNSPFFLKGNNVYAGMSYSISALNLPPSVSTPFRNLEPYDIKNGNTTYYRMNEYNIQFRSDSTISYYRQPIGNINNNLYLCAGEAVGVGGKVPFFGGQSVTSPTDYSNVQNISLGALEYFFLPLSYYTSNFSINGSSLSSGGKCENLSPGSLPYPTNVINYLYFAWASGYPIANGGGPITRPEPGFLLSGAGDLDLGGWTQINECQIGYYYDYCSGSDICGNNNCYGGCPTAEKPFCDPNPYFTKSTENTGLSAFECEKSASPPKSIISVKVIIAIVIVAVVILLTFILLLWAALHKKAAPPKDGFSVNY